LLVLTSASLAAWAVLAVPAALLGGPASLVYSAAALGICLVPAALTLAWGWGARGQIPVYQTAVALGGAGIRLFAVLGAAAALYCLTPYFHEPQLFIWVALFYPLTLALEVRILLAGLKAARAEPAQPQGEPGA
jgi:hypothetical protein